MSTSFISGINPPETDKPGYWFIFQGFRLLVVRHDDRAEVPLLRSPVDLGIELDRQIYLGFLERESGAVDCYCGVVAESTKPPDGCTFENLRPLYTLLDEETFWLAGRAIQIVDWDRTSQFCGRCGQKNEVQSNERSKICPQCKLMDYPRLAPAIIVRITRQTAQGPEILLARAKRFPTAMFSVLAGFVEPGENLEECVEREIWEEVGIRVRNIRYFGSQPWPFPHSLMVAFTAEHDSGEISIDPAELADASWFAPHTLPAIPPPPSIANKLIQAFIDETVHRVRSDGVSM